MICVRVLLRFSGRLHVTTSTATFARLCAVSAQIYATHQCRVISTMSNKQFAQEGLLSTEYVTTPHHNRFTDLSPGPPGWAGARRELLDFRVQGKINRGRHTDHPARRHSTGLTSAHLQHPHIFFYRPDALPAIQPTASKHWRSTD